MTTENTVETEGTLIEIHRTIDELLKLDTYQDMTDDEIDRIIEFKENTAYQNGYNARWAEDNESTMTTLKEHWQEQADKSEAAFNNAVLTAVKFQTVGDE